MSINILFLWMGFDSTELFEAVTGFRIFFSIHRGLKVSDVPALPENLHSSNPKRSECKLYQKNYTQNNSGFKLGLIKQTLK